MGSIEPVWLFGAIALVCGVFLGMLINRFMNPSASDNDQLKADLEHARTEMERYKSSVNSHFNKTSDLVNELTQDYVKVYRHLAEGAQTLSDTREFTQVLDQPQGQVLITVEKESSVEDDVDAAVVAPDEQAQPADKEAGTASLPVDEDAAAERPAQATDDLAAVEIADDEKSQNTAADTTTEAVDEASAKEAADGIDNTESADKVENTEDADKADIDEPDRNATAEQAKSDAGDADAAPAETADTTETETAKKVKTKADA